MKNTLVLLFSVVIGFVGSAFADTQPTSLGYVRFQVSSATIANINQTAPLGAYELVGCTDCVQSTLCISSGTGTGAYVVVSSSHSVGSLGSMVHCR